MSHRFAYDERPRHEAAGIDYERLYEFRFRHVTQRERNGVWHEIARTVYDWLGRPQRVLDAAAGHGEFIDAVPAREKWAIDAVDFLGPRDDVHKVIGDIRDVALPERHFDAIFVSNFLEHLAHADEIGALLQRFRAASVFGGRIAVLGPNFRYCARTYFDCADHKVALTHLSVEEHLYAAGYQIERVIPRFLPYSFRGVLPTAPALVRAYLKFAPAWQVLGRQYLVIGVNPGR